jgi:hypothetical protein
MYAATVAEASSYALLLVLIAWICTLAATAAVVLFVARWAFTKAESKDVPKVLTGLAHLLQAAYWTKDLTGLLGRSSEAESPSPQPAALDADPVDGDAMPDGKLNDDHQGGGAR